MGRWLFSSAEMFLVFRGFIIIGVGGVKSAFIRDRHLPQVTLSLCAGSLFWKTAVGEAMPMECSHCCMKWQRASYIMLGEFRAQSVLLAKKSPGLIALLNWEHPQLLTALCDHSELLPAVLNGVCRPFSHSGSLNLFVHQSAVTCQILRGTISKQRYQDLFFEGILNRLKCILNL